MTRGQTDINKTMELWFTISLYILFCFLFILQISIQTDPVKTYPPPGPKILKNKALLCRPLVQNKGVSCKTQTADVEAQTGKSDTQTPCFCGNSICALQLSVNLQGQDRLTH